MLTLILVTVASGIVMGFAGWLPALLVRQLDALITYGVSLVVFAVGIDIGRNREVWGQLRRLGFVALFLPLAVVVGTLAGSSLMPLFSPLKLPEALAVGAGLGWYSLSGVLITKLHSPELGALAFLSNVLRELLSFLIIPLLARLGGVFTIIAPGGATSMDTTLPLIDRFTGSRGALLAFVNGLILTGVVPILVPIALRLGG
jgi:uncharacterized membrane protein YbjE (DUF340 family)